MKSDFTKQIVLMALVSLVLISKGSGETGSDLKATPPFKQQIPELNRSSQLILVLASDWREVAARLSAFERDKDGNWTATGISSDVVLGRKGMAWGIGLHGSYDREGSCKKEGDDRAPAGVFELDEIFGSAQPSSIPRLHFPYRHITATIEAIDDPRSRYYNRLVDARTVKATDWLSSERMLRKDDLYRWGIVVRHNWQQSPGDGSCIFLHTWMGPRQGTSGCTAMPALILQKLIHWIDRVRRPLLVQLPKTEYERLSPRWRLPVVSMAAPN